MWIENSDWLCGLLTLCQGTCKSWYYTSIHIQNILKELNDYIHAHVLIHPNIIKGGTGL